MFRFLIFCALVTSVIYFFGEHLVKWFSSLGKAAERVEYTKWEEFDKKLNPPKVQKKTVKTKKVKK